MPRGEKFNLMIKRKFFICRLIMSIVELKKLKPEIS